MNSIGIKLRRHDDSGLVYKREKAQVWMSFKKPYQVLGEYVALLLSLKTMETPIESYISGLTYRFRRIQRNQSIQPPRSNGKSRLFALAAEQSAHDGIAVDLDSGSD